MKAWVFYHRACTDGAAAAYAAWMKFGDSAMYTPIDFNDIVLPTVTKGWLGDARLDIYFLDVTPDVECINRLVELDHRVHIVDHHKTFHELLYKFEIGAAKSVSKRHCTEHAGSRLAWDLFHDTAVYPDIIKYTNDYDLYRFKYGADTHHYQVMFEQVDLSDIKAIEAFSKIPTHEVLAMGRIALSTKLHYAREIVKTGAFPVKFGSHKAMFCMAPRVFRNDIADIMMSEVEGTGVEFAIICESFGIENRISLRGRKDCTVDLADLAKTFGGGGHPRAAGFVTESLYMFGIGAKPHKGFWSRLFDRLKR